MFEKSMAGGWVPGMACSPCIQSVTGVMYVPALKPFLVLYVVTMPSTSSST